MRRRRRPKERKPIARWRVWLLSVSATCNLVAGLMGANPVGIVGGAVTFILLAVVLRVHGLADP